MLRTKKSDASALCAEFCTYYKPGRNEQLACQGYLVIQRLMERGITLPLVRREHASAPDTRNIEGLRARVCAACAFREADCDFILTEGRAEPCGGMVLLIQLLAGGEISMDEIGQVR